MQIKDILSPSETKKKNEKLGEIVRFIIVGTLAVIIQYSTYLLLIQWLHPLFSNTIAYIIFNYIASTKYTFRVQSTAKRGAGFIFSHVINYLLQTFTLHIFLSLGLKKQLAMVPMFAICVPINFLLVRFFLKKK